MAQVNDTEDCLYSILETQTTIPREEFSHSMTLDQAGLDSLAAIELMFQIEDKFGIHFDQDGTLPNTIGDLIDQIAAKLPGN